MLPENRDEFLGVDGRVVDRVQPVHQHCVLLLRHLLRRVPGVDIASGIFYKRPAAILLYASRDMYVHGTYC